MDIDWGQITPDSFDEDQERFIYHCKFNHMIEEGRALSKEFIIARVSKMSEQWPEYNLHDLQLNLADDKHDLVIKSANYKKWKEEVLERFKNENPALTIKISALI